MLTNILKFEWQYHFRQLSFLASVVLFFAMGFYSVNFAYGPDSVNINSPYAISVLLSIQSLISLFVVTLFCANGVLRDTEYKVQEMIFSTAVNKWQYLSSRLIGVISGTAMVFAFSLIGMMLGAGFFSDPERIGLFSLYNYLWPVAIIVIPNVLLNIALLFSISVLTRSIAATYVSGVFLYILYFTGSMLGNSPLMANSSPTSPENVYLFSLLDPYGLAAFFGETQFWTPEQRNTQFPSLEGFFLINRFFWLMISVIVLFITYSTFSFKVNFKRLKKQSKEVKEAFVPVTYKTVVTFSEQHLARWNMFLARVKLEVLTIVKSIPFIVMALLWVFMMGIEITETIFSGIFNISSYPTTGLILNILKNASPILIPVIFYGGELMWRERDVKINELIDAAPLSSVVLFLSKCASMAIVIGVFFGINILTGIIVQLASGYFQLELPVYLSLFYYNGLPLFLFGILVLLVQSIIPNKYFGMAVSGFVIVLILLAPRFGVEHHLLRYAAIPELAYSAMNGFGHFVQAFHWNMIYWSAFGGIVIIMTFAFWRRGIHLINLKPQLGNGSKAALGICILVAIGSGSYIYFETNVKGQYMTSEKRIAWKVDYEKKYKQFRDLPQPVITEVKTTVDLFPENREYHVEGTYKVENKSSQMIRNVLVGIDPEVSQISLSLSGATPTAHDERFNHYWFELKEPLKPGKQLELTFNMKVSKSGFMRFNNENSIVSNGSYIELEKYLPFFGYGYYELNDPVERTKRGLPVQTSWTKIEDAKPENYNWVLYETIVSTTSDQQVVTVGDLEGEWKKEGRRYSHFKANQPIPFMFAIASARYEVVKAIHRDVEIEFYYQSGHEYNIDQIIASAKHALDYYSENFSPYQYKHLRFAEIPHYRGAATAYPGTIYIVENQFLHDYSNPEKPNYAYAMAHEVSHQWWAGQLEPADVQGYKTLTETLAQYSEYVILEQKYGRGKLNSYIENDMDAYLANRGFGDEDELPLFMTESQSHVHYQKGGIVMNGLKRLVGEEKLNESLNNLIQKHSFPNRKPTTLDFLKEVYQVADVNDHVLIDDWFKRIILYDMKVESATAKRLDDGRYKVDVKITTNRYEDEPKRGEKALKMNEMIEVGIFTEYPDVASGNQVLYLEKHRFESGKVSLSFVVDRKPEVVGIDPYLTRIDRNRIDNVITVEEL